MARARAGSKDTDVGEQGAANTEPDLLGMLRAAAARTERALAAATSAETSPASGGTLESMTPLSPAGPVRAGRFGANPPEVIERRVQDYEPPDNPDLTGVLGKYAREVASASVGAVTV